MGPPARCIGIIDTATRKFPMAYLPNIELQNLGYMSGFLTRTIDRTKPVLGDLIWMDRNRRYLIFTGGLMGKGRPYTHMRLEARGPCPKYRAQYG